MITNLITKIFGNKHDRDIKKLSPTVGEINEHFEALADLSDDELRQKTDEFKQKIQEETREVTEEIVKLRTTLKGDFETNGAVEGEDDPARMTSDDLRARVSELEEEETEIIEETLEEILPEVFAAVKETCRRLLGQQWTIVGQKIEWDMVHFDVQLLGGIALHQGKITEMATGEGKTLVATLPLYLNALAGKGVHLVTVNDYLAQRDCEWMGKVFDFLGVSTAYITHDMSNDERRAAYHADITYGTNNEFGFDYLRDNMAVRLEDRVQRKHWYAIVDEVDSVLVDEARTPLIISGPVESSSNEQYQIMKPRVEALVRKQGHLINRFVSDGEKLLSEKKEEEAGLLLLKAVRGAPKHKKLTKLMNETGVKRLIHSIENEFIRDKKMHEVDEELYYAIDEKANTIDMTDIGRDYLAPNDPEMFILPELSELTHAIDNDEEIDAQTKLEKKEKVFQDYTLKADQLQSIQQLLKAYSLFEKDVEYVVTEGKVIIVDEFTGRLMAGRRFSDGLHQALEAKEGVKIEGETQTLATITLQNYFRMYKKLAGMTGTAETEAGEFWEIYKLDVLVIPTNKPMNRADEEDQVYKTRREKYNALINEIEEKYKAKQPVLVGTITVDVSETLGRMLKRRGIPHSVLNAKQHQKEAEIVANAGQPGRITIATNMAGRGTDIKLGAGVVKTADDGSKYGGLHIIGTERHESRRIDRQLRGRSGRQGDPGSSRFYLSLEDDLMRLFSPERIINVMDRLGLEEGEVIEHPMITKSIERAQKRVEGHNFEIRKHLLEYDNVMNQQREVIYDRRGHALRGESLREETTEMLRDAVAGIVAQYADADVYAEEWDISTIRTEFETMFLAEWPLTEEQENDLSNENLQEKLFKAALEAYEMREQLFGKEAMRDLERQAQLMTIDTKWRDHLYEMDRLKEGINLRAYGQKDPLIEYKREGFALFQTMLNSIDQDILKLIFRAQLRQAEPMPRQRRAMPRQMVASHKSSVGMGFSGRAQAPREQKAGKRKPVVVEQKVGRNEPCPCGSGKKYKKCHGKVAV